TIQFDLANISKIKDKKIYLNGFQGDDRISFKEVTHTGSDDGLRIDLSGSDSIVQDIKTSGEVLRFSNFNHITGSKANDIFILPSAGFNFSIDGGGGTSNAVSSEQYNFGIYI